MVPAHTRISHIIAPKTFYSILIALPLNRTAFPNRRTGVPGRVLSSYNIPLRIALRQPREPFHLSYGKRLFKEDVEALVAPPASSFDAAHEWLESHGVQKGACHMSPAGDWVTVRLPVAQVEKVLGPPCLEHIELIRPPTVFNRAKAQRATYHFTDLDSDTAASLPILIREDHLCFYQVPAAVNTSFNVVLINGGLNNRTLAEAGDEAGVDWLYFVLEQHSIPQVISTSSADEERSVPMGYAHRVYRGFAQLGARGVSLFSSGDGGVVDGDPDPVTQICFTNHSKNETRFLFQRPSWREAAVTKFFESLPEGTYAGLFNSSGRASPDVSAQVESFRIFHQGRLAHGDGTSESAPSVAAFVAVLNDARIVAGKPSLGFLNPLIYALNGAGFNDITTGNTPGCGTPGFNATTGWNSVTGFRTPDFEVLKEINACD
ncbi:tripeptidyl peptidase A [Lactarius akahatsu]|uniref:Tripeptidyl peptidase A n=1 Tax=Lactarius akahatsu TaxID=416441 RepID=A0AAD4Q8E2_9AGAM|nr:tripeptidyl peptidase A [Lactarius akahatsu]